MPRPVWNGAISFGLVSIPVKLYSATQDRSVRFHQLDGNTGARVRQKRVSEVDGSEVEYRDIVKGYELSSGKHVVITDEELAALDPKASRTIDLLEFVDGVDIDPIYYESAYFLGPDPATPKPYALLQRAMAEAGKVGIATFVMRGKEHLAALRPDQDRIVLSTMRYEDEIRDTEEIDGFEELEDVEVSDKELSMANALIDSLSAEFDPARFHDDYREKVLDLISRKEGGDEEIVVAEAPEEDNTVVDLMAALEASVKGAKEARRRHPTGEASESADDGERAEGSTKRSGTKKATSKKATSKKAAAKKSTKKAGAKKSAAKKSSTRKSA